MEISSQYDGYLGKHFLFLQSYHTFQKPFCTSTFKCTYKVLLRKGLSPYKFKVILWQSSNPEKNGRNPLNGEKKKLLHLPTTMDGL